MESVPEVLIDSNGVFKYILVRLSAESPEQSRDIVRGTASAEYHSKRLRRGPAWGCSATYTSRPLTFRHVVLQSLPAADYWDCSRWSVGLCSH
ncbi:hypothetical protein GDO78_013801 [Eleutherodactylus coqui]|uniref:Uncharacterized protein n=1 Tax=Eleutherodactylus coqui TaxID=57060 RepID=A0A8J6C1L3_ELECQ|nr:hypothetical protein GDO78_013801 [Eleutherodactylus coqui]